MTAVFTWNLATDELSWSDAMFDLYGYSPGSVQPTMKLLLDHKHGDDRSTVRHMVKRARNELQPYVLRHHIITIGNEQRDIVVAAGPTRVERGRATEITGTAIDLTEAVTAPSFASEQREARDLRTQIEHLKQALESRDVIGQAKGILMHTYSIRDAEAFELLRLASQRANRKLHDIALDVTRTGKLQVD